MSIAAKTDKPPYDIADLVPHSGTMSLLDDTLSSDENSLTATVGIRPDSLFATEQGVPAWVGIEYMAQAIAAFAGVQARLAGEDIRIGFLVGSRKYTCDAPYFPIGSTLTIHVARELQGENGLGVFICRITSETDSANMIVAEANLNVFQPDDAAEFLKNEISEG
ncbi:hotdog family protein [Aestuariicella sp. G3-2]|uniref:ApeP family dehydratase n=1 Tax=Pseudomaricurvus albidus TaxID=2842452 RepID=UPI001C0D3F98|nr:hotdog family protein [Aestuariicella albida]MBU3070631.1 hotdog family protein [Aestuariicella albida]